MSTHFGAFMRRKNQSDEKREPIIRNYKTKLPKFINHYKSVKIKERKKKSFIYKPLQICQNKGEKKKKAWNRIELITKRI